MKISIVIVTYNSKNIISNCLESIYSSTNKEIDIELIIIDNNSQDGTQEVIKNFSDIRLIENKQNLGFATACNQGIENATSDYILFLNPDTIILDNAITKSYSFIQSNEVIGILGCRQTYPNGKILRSCRNFPSITNMVFVATGLSYILRNNKLFSNFYLTEKDYCLNQEVDVVSGSFFFVKRRVIEQIGFFDDRFFMYGEEMDFCYRAKQAGWMVFYYSEAEIIHYEGYSANKEENIVNMFLQLHKSTNLFFKFHYPKSKAYILNKIGFLETGFRFILWTFIHNFKPNTKSNLNKLRYYKVFQWYLKSGYRFFHTNLL